MAATYFTQLCFNELTLQPLCIKETEVYKKIMLYGNTLLAAKLSLGIQVIRYPDDLHNLMISDKMSLYDFCAKYRHQEGIRFILTSFNMPLTDSADANQVQDVSATIENGRCNSLGFAAAYANGVPTTGFYSEEYWDKVMYNINVVSASFSGEICWPCLTLPEHLIRENFQKWIINCNNINLVETSLLPEEKPIKLRRDHGRETLLEHAKKLCNNKYVEGVVQSLSFKPNYAKYIRNLNSGGLVDIVLHWDDRGLSMRLKTTGRNKRETAAIAEILRKGYDFK